jgi:hypothetical protein
VFHTEFCIDISTSTHKHSKNKNRYCNMTQMFDHVINPFTASCENAVPGIPASCGKFPHSSQLSFWSTESIFNQFSVFLKTLNALCVCLQYKHPRSIKRVIRSDKPVTLLLLFWSHKCDFGAEPRSRIIATSAVKGLMTGLTCNNNSIHQCVYQPSNQLK